MLRKLGRRTSKSPHEPQNSIDSDDTSVYGPLNTAPLLSCDTLGLSLVRTCINPLVDIIFVHGPGGTSIRTWSWQRDPQNFWPAWLGEDPVISKSRIFTFGYNANFSGQYTRLNILDFAKELLFGMNTYSSEGSVNDRPIGSYPLIFCHAFYGRAYIIGKSDEQYASITSKIHAMLFLATLHRGSSYLDIFYKILRTTPDLSPKVYVTELEKSFTSIQDINE